MNLQDLLSKKSTHTQRERPAGLYRLTSPSGRSYIGISVNPHQRWLEHKNCADNGSPGALFNAIRKYGFENFKKEVLVVTTFEHVKLLEVRAIEAYKTLAPNGYNLTLGGDGTVGFRNKPEVIARIASKIRGLKRSAETLKKLSESHKGYVFSDERKKAVSEKSKNTPRHEQWCKAISDSKKGKPLTDVQRAARSASQKRKWADPEYKRIQVEKQKLGSAAKRLRDKEASILPASAP